MLKYVLLSSNLVLPIYHFFISMTYGAERYHFEIDLKKYWISCTSVDTSLVSHTILNTVHFLLVMFTLVYVPHHSLHILIDWWKSGKKSLFYYYHIFQRGSLRWISFFGCANPFFELNKTWGIHNSNNGIYERHVKRIANCVHSRPHTEAHLVDE